MTRKSKKGPMIAGVRFKAHWRSIIMRAWSVRFMALAVIFTGLEAFLPFGHDLGFLDFLPGGLFALLTCVVVMAAFISRLVAQKNLSGDC